MTFQPVSEGASGHRSKPDSAMPITCADARNRGKVAVQTPVLDSQTLGMPVASLWELDYQRRLSFSLSRDRSLTFAGDQSPLIQTQMDVKGQG